MAAGGKGTITGKLFRAQEHDDLTVYHDLIREIAGIQDGVADVGVASLDVLDGQVVGQVARADDSAPIREYPGPRPRRTAGDKNFA